MKRPNAQLLALQVENWNLKHAVGTPVTLRKDNDEVMLTKTRSEAQVLSGHSAVIWVEGVAGCYLLDRVEAV